MTVTLNVRYRFIEQYKLLPMKGIRLRNFKVVSKTDYDHGDCEYIFVANHNTSIENIELVCKEYNFISNITIRILVTSTNKYELGTIGAIVTTTRKL